MLPSTRSQHFRSKSLRYQYRSVALFSRKSHTARCGFVNTGTNIVLIGSDDLLRFRWGNFQNCLTGKCQLARPSSAGLHIRTSSRQRDNAIQETMVFHCIRPTLFWHVSRKETQMKQFFVLPALLLITVSAFAADIRAVLI